MKDWTPKYTVYFEDGTFMYCSSYINCQTVLKKAAEYNIHVSKVTGPKLIFTIQDPVEQLKKEVIQCQENGQQP